MAVVPEVLQDTKTLKSIDANLSRIADCLEKLYSIQMIIHRAPLDQFPTNEMGRVLRCNLNNNRMLRQLKMAWDDVAEPDYCRQPTK